MRVVVIKDEEAKALLEKLQLIEFRLKEEHDPALVDEIHRKFHFEVTRWLQAQGCVLR